MSPQAEAASTRPRVEGDRESEILLATLEVLAEVGYDRLTMDAVATKAKASKATLYRRWNGKVQLVIDALQHGHPHDGAPPELPDTGSLREDLLLAYCGHGGLTDKPEVAAFGAIITAIMRDADFAQAFREQVLAPKMAAARELFARALERGQLRADVDIDLLAPALAGIVLNRLVLLGEPPSRELIEQVVDQIILPAATAVRG